MESQGPLPTVDPRDQPIDITPQPGENLFDGDIEKRTEHSSEQNSIETATVTGGRTIVGLRWFVVCVALYICCFLYGLDTTIAADIQGPVIERFGHVEQLTWIGAGFPLGSVCVILPLGNLYNAFNIKWTFIISVLLFEVGSALCGGAPTMSALIVGRVIAGAGGSGIYLGSLNYFLAMTVPEERGFYMALIGFFWGIGAVLGPVIGGGFAVSSATWRWAFYINLVVFAVSAPVHVFYLPSIHPSQGVSGRERLVRLDLIGFVLGAGVWVAFLLALTMAGSQWAWDDGRTIATFVVFGVTLIAYALQQYFASSRAKLIVRFRGIYFSNVLKSSSTSRRQPVSRRCTLLSITSPFIFSSRMATPLSWRLYGCFPMSSSPFR